MIQLLVRSRGAGAVLARAVLADTILFGAVLTGAISSADAVPYLVTPDAPTQLDGDTFFPHEVVRAEAGSYVLALGLPARVQLDALHRLDGGDWLLSLQAPAVLGDTAYDPRDVVRRHDGGSFSLFLDGAAAGIPYGANVDTLSLEGGDDGDVVLGFDAPVQIGPMRYPPGDLVRFTGGSFSLYFDSESAGLPPGVDVTAADLRGGLLVLSFDVPVTIVGFRYLPGDLVSWNGTSFALFQTDPSWPTSSRINGLAFLPAPGEAPLVTVLSKAETASGVRLTLGWSASCLSGAENYGIYEGELGNWSSHAAVDCSDDGSDLQEEIDTQDGDRYFLVVPFNSAEEGSYGRLSTGAERPAGAPACVAPQRLRSCP